jgi:hypothetical protein
MSLVVPGTGVTMAASLCANRHCLSLNREARRVERRHTEVIEKAAFPRVGGAEDGEADTGADDLATTAVRKVVFYGVSEDESFFSR